MSSEVKPYSKEEDSKKEQVRRMFDRIAPHYDSLNMFLSAGMDKRWRKTAIGMLDVPKEALVLDVATGTGDLAFEIARQFEDAQVTGLDLAENMLVMARKKSAKRGLSSRVHFTLGDSEDLPFEDHSFHSVSVAFGVRNFGDLPRGMREIFRVLKPGGRLVVLEFTKPRTFPFKQLFQFYFKHILPFVGSFGSGDKRAYHYLYESVQAFPDYDRFTAVLSTNGFKNAGFKVLSLGICAIYTAEK
ncbi:MAG: bifunctional demethylmenaquinone methyltransferase/2-methoxy-6-polyprenyl-1,4-benzoquinol methylase UbiE [Bacteroidetes bacterium]|nr:MAG: bifunctional demethylmenaquinone methyltransferase/2-methoxy-6-polyprenyl-1,4-benzoquinol methylase UbiE [Bacteroidota bacterium]